MVSAGCDVEFANNGCCPLVEKRPDDRLHDAFATVSWYSMIVVHNAKPLVSWLASGGGYTQ